ncbi:MAG: type IV pilus assembly protein PilM [Candidatus Saccharimonadales bacterium]
MRQRLFFHDKPVIGIDITHTYIKAMSVDITKWSVTSYGSITTDPTKLLSSLTESSDYLSEAITTLIKENIVGKLPSDHAVISIPTNLTYSRSLRIPKAAVKKLEDAILLEAEQYIPIPLSELNVSYEVLSQTSDSIEVLMSAAPKKIIANVIRACQSAGLWPLLIQPSINAASRLIMLTEEGTLPTVMVDIGARTTDLAILNERIRANASLQIGGNYFTYVISKKLNISLEQAHQIKILHGLAHGNKQARIADALRPSLEQMITEIRKIIRYYDERIDSSQKIQQIVIIGSGSNLPGIGEFFTNELVMPARIASPWLALDFGLLPPPPKQFRPRYMTAAGIASIEPGDIWK